MDMLIMMPRAFGLTAAVVSAAGVFVHRSRALALEALGQAMAGPGGVEHAVISVAVSQALGNRLAAIGKDAGIFRYDAWLIGVCGHGGAPVLVR
jgi:hypothetical protein